MVHLYAGNNGVQKCPCAALDREKFLKCDVYPSRSSAEKATWLLVWRTTGPCLNTLSE